jgi:uncharacterized protein YbjQ (UPF0145 family)
MQAQAAHFDPPATLGAGGLSVGAAALVLESGYIPVGQVMGCSVFHIGIQWSNPRWRNSDRKQARTTGVAFEMDVMTRAFYQARHLAMSRMRQEAALLNATGVAGVQLSHQPIEGEPGVLEFVAWGTALRDQGRLRAGAEKKPFLSNLAGTELWQLKQAGFRPVGLAVGNCTYLYSPDWTTQCLLSNSALSRRGRQNQELPAMTQALYAARELAMERMAGEAREYGAGGIVGATVEMETSFTDAQAAATPAAVQNSNVAVMLSHFLAIGTAIAPAGSGGDREIAPVILSAP